MSDYNYPEIVEYLRREISDLRKRLGEEENYTVLADKEVNRLTKELEKAERERRGCEKWKKWFNWADSQVAKANERLQAENADLRSRLEGTYSKGYSLLQIENPTGRAYVFPYSPREDVFKTDTQKWSLVEVNGLKILIAASRITKQIAVGVIDATPM